MSPIRQSLLVRGNIRPAASSKGEVRAHAAAVLARRHEFVGRKAAKACAVLVAAVRRQTREGR